jgi:hypothetical protein
MRCSPSFALPIASVLALAACGGSSDFAMDTTSPDGGGAGGTASGGGGAPGAGGSTASGGSSATGGSVAADGSFGTGGVVGTGGQTNTGGNNLPESGADVGGGDSATPACAKVECSGFAAALTAAPRDANAIANCATQVHELDCCGARAVYGINHGARTTLCPAEASCTAQYATPATCTDASITTDTGETTTDISNVKLRCVPISGGSNCKCETFVCATNTCAASPGVEGGCG